MNRYFIFDTTLAEVKKEDVDFFLMVEKENSPIEITENEYNKGIEVKKNGGEVKVVNDKVTFFKGEKITIWNKLTREPSEILDYENVPDTHTTLSPDGICVFENGKWVKTKAQKELDFYHEEAQWVYKELLKVDVELRYHWTDDKRATYTEEKWKQYARELRDYTTQKDGKKSVNGKRPVIA